jgi:hypothetical protein
MSARVISERHPRKTWVKASLVAFLVAIPAFMLGPIIWPPAEGSPSPTATQLPFLLFLNLVQATVLGLGVAFLAFGRVNPCTSEGTRTARSPNTASVNPAKFNFTSVAVDLSPVNVDITISWTNKTGRSATVYVKNCVRQSLMTNTLRSTLSCGGTSICVLDEFANVLTLVAVILGSSTALGKGRLASDLRRTIVLPAMPRLERNRIV